MTQSEKAKAIATVLKKRFPNLSVDEVLDIAFKILDIVNEE